MEENFNFRNAFLLSVAVLVLIAAAMMYKANSTEAVYIEINEGIGISANRLGKVINSFELDKDGAVAIESVPIDTMSYHEAVGKLLDRGIRDGYFKKGEKLPMRIWLEKSAVNNRYDIIERNLKEAAGEYSITAQCSELDAGISRTAEEYGISAGKYLMICELQKIDSSISLDVYKDYSPKMLRRIYLSMTSGMTKDQVENELGSKPGEVMRFIRNVLFESGKEE